MDHNCNLRCDDHRSFLKIPDNQGAKLTQLVQCNRCDLVFEDPRPSQEEIEAFYTNTELWTNSTDAEGNPRSYVKELLAKQPVFQDVVTRIEKYKQRGHLLDIGCGPGLLETVLDSSRWKVLGIEMSEYIAEFGRNELSTNVVSGKFEQIDLPEHHFDTIVMKYVLDHMEEPFEALQKARKLIKPDGVLLIADLINIDSFCARYFGAGHRLIHPMHFTYFSPKTIKFHLERAGFQTIKIEYPYFQTPYFNFPNLKTLASRILERFINQYILRNNKVVYSMPFYGNMMDIWAIPK